MGCRGDEPLKAWLGVERHGARAESKPPPRDSIPDHVRPDGCQLAHVCARHAAAAMRKVDQAVPGRKQRLSQARRSLRIEFMDVLVRVPHPAQCGSGPDDTHKSGVGRGDSLAPDQLPKPPTDTFMRHDPPCSHVRLGFGVEACLGRLVGRQIENRLNVCLSRAHVPLKARIAQIGANGFYPVK